MTEAMWLLCRECWLSQAACLVLLGGGSFQKLALTSYLYRTKNQTHIRCVHLVCVKPVYDREYKHDF